MRLLHMLLFGALLACAPAVMAQEDPIPSDEAVPAMEQPVESDQPTDTPPAVAPPTAVVSQLATNASFVPELTLTLPQEQRSDQPVTAKLLKPIKENPLFGFSNLPTLPRDNPQNQNPEPYDTVASPIGVPLFDSYDRGSASGGDSNLVSFFLPGEQALYTYNCRSGQCQGSAADVWMAMPASQREQYLSALLDAYEPVAEMLGRPNLNQLDGRGPSRHAEVWIQPHADRMTIWAAAKVDLEPDGSLTKWYVGPHLVSDVNPSDKIVAAAPGRWIRVRQTLVDWTSHLQD